MERLNYGFTAPAHLFHNVKYSSLFSLVLNQNWLSKSRSQQVVNENTLTAIWILFLNFKITFFGLFICASWNRMLFLVHGKNIKTRIHFFAPEKQVQLFIITSLTKIMESLSNPSSSSVNCFGDFFRAFN